MSLLPSLHNQFFLSPLIKCSRFHCSNHSFSLSPRSPSHSFSSDCSRYSSAQRPGSETKRQVRCKSSLTGSFRSRKENCAERRLPAASAINSLVQSASAASAREATPGADADSGPERNSAAQSPESASAATSGAASGKWAVFNRLKYLRDH